jgi:hypothetical protein
VDDGQITRPVDTCQVRVVVDLHHPGHSRMQTREVIAQIDRAGTGNEQSRSITCVVFRIPVRNNRIDTVITASLENKDQLCVLLAPRVRKNYILRFEEVQT